jgi:glycosyltransferase involved in cell wall biosynthesis
MVLNNVGWVVIGRNEGDRLVRCFRSIRSACKVYVDSGSTDASLTNAVEFGFDTVQLDLRLPFTAARARNAGWARLLVLYPQLDYVMFVDGDCELESEWINRAVAYLEQNPNVAVVCGRRKERFPEQSIYNFLCDLEWDTPVGEASACGGDALFRFTMIRLTEGFREDMIAGEEPELCFRIAGHGGKIFRLDLPMTLHDAAMHGFRQWWNRTKRGGYAFGLGFWLHHKGERVLWRKEVFSIVFWGIFIPLILLTLLGIVGLKGLLLLIVYPLQVLRLSVRFLGQHPNAVKRAFLLVVGKFAETDGLLKFAFDVILRRRSKLIEYK